MIYLIESVDAGSCKCGTIEHKFEAYKIEICMEAAHQIKLFALRNGRNKSKFTKKFFLSGKNEDEPLWTKLNELAKSMPFCIMYRGKKNDPL
ncbi:MAG: hypothetical protein ABUT20_47245 [Bacteroidota bacterium]